MEFRTLGPVEVWNGDGWVPVPAAKQRALLAILLLRPGRVDRDWLIETLWNGRAPASAGRLLSHYVWRLRDLLPDGGMLQTVPAGYALHAGDDAVDHRRFTALAAAGREAARHGDVDRTVDHLTAGLNLWQGRALADAPSLPVLEDAVRQLSQLRLEASETLAEAQLRRGRPAEAVFGLEELTRAEPFRERPWSLLMLALHRLGRRADALQTYQRLWRTWTDQLGTEPRHDLRELHRRILDDDPSLTADEAPAGTAAGVASVSRPPRPAQLPADPPRFTGRVAELDLLLAAFPGGRHDAAGALVGVVDGMAGVGKTTLAVHAAHRFADRYPDGQLFIDLCGYTDGVGPVTPDDALARLPRTLGVAGGEIPQLLDDRAALWRSTLADRRMLILLDNAATESQVRPLLPGSAGCLVLVTSRTRLVGLDSVASISLDVMSTGDARALFANVVGQQRLAGQPPELVSEIVELCGRLPLAIRVAAARLAAHPTWTPAQLADRLRDHRHRLAELESGERSVAAAVDLSCRQLTPAAQRMYRLLGLHPGADFGSHAAAAVADTTVHLAERLLEELVGAHLLQEISPGRYRFHDLVRIRAAQSAAGEDTDEERRAASGRIFDHYRHTAYAAVKVLYPYRNIQRVPTVRVGPAPPELPDEDAAGSWLDTELANLLATVDHAADQGRSSHILAMSAVLDHHLRARGHHTDAEALHVRALAAARGAGDVPGEVASLNALGYTHRLLGRSPAAVECFQQALTIARAVGHRAGELGALEGLGHAYRAQARYESAVTCFEAALTIARDIGHHDRELPALQGLGYVCRAQGRYEPAAEYFERALAIARDIGYRGGELGALSGLGYVSRALGRYRQGVAYFQQALDLARTARHRAAEVGALWGLGQIHHAQDEHETAADCFRNALRVADEIGDCNGQFEARHGLGLTACATGRPDLALDHHQAALDLARELGQPVDQARATHGLANAHRQLGHDEEAGRYRQLALDLLDDLDVDEIEEVSAAAIRAGHS